MPSLTNILIFGAVAYGLSQTVFKKAPKGKNPADTVKKTAESVADKAPKPSQLVCHSNRSKFCASCVWNIVHSNISANVYSGASYSS